MVIWEKIDLQLYNASKSCWQNGREMGGTSLAGRQRVQRLFDLDKMVHEWEHLFENLLQRKQTW
jgi:hypothetical protein